MPDSRDPVASGVSAGRMVARKARRSRRSEPVHGSGSQPESARGVCGGSPENRRVTWLSHKTKTGGSAGETGSGRAEKLRCRWTRGGITGLASGGRGLWRRCGCEMKRSAT
jgi:hypothetical protein